MSAKTWDKMDGSGFQHKEEDMYHEAEDECWGWAEGEEDWRGPNESRMAGALGKGKGNGVVCFKCNQTGHIARN